MGGGFYKEYYENMAEELGVSKWVTFTGNIGDKGEIRRLLSKADIFVFPTHTEGLPRVLIEAMACSLPCISTPVGGIPELLEPSYLLDHNDAEGFADKIIELITHPEERKRQSERNYQKALEYEYEALNRRRKEYYDALIQRSEISYESI